MTKYISPNDKNQKGFSLVEVLIAIGILSIFVSGIITLFLNSNKAQKGLEQKNEALILSQQIQSILSSSKGGGDTKCSLLLGIKNLPISPAPIMSINIGGVSYQQGQNYIKESGLFFKQLNLLNIENSGTEVKDGIQTIKYRAEITYQMSKNASGKQISSGVSEFRPVSIPILIFVQASNGLIYDCTRIDKGYNSALCSDEFD